MLSQFPDNSSWRQHNITIHAKEVFTLNFRDTKPNIFVVNNPNMSTLKIGLSAIPREDSYEFKVEYNTTETLGRPIGSNNLYILNDSAVDIKIVVFSIEKEFDPTILKNMNVSLDGYTIEANAEIRGIKEGIKLPISLDTDSLSSLSGTKSGISWLISKEILSSYTNLASLKKVLEEISDKVEPVDNWVNSNLVSFEETDVTEKVFFTNAKRFKINNLINDGTTDIKMIITKDNNTYDYKVKAGETLKDFTIENSTNCGLSVTAYNTGETITYRILGEYV